MVSGPKAVRVGVTTLRGFFRALLDELLICSSFAGPNAMSGAVTSQPSGRPRESNTVVRRNHLMYHHIQTFPGGLAIRCRPASRTA